MWFMLEQLNSQIAFWNRINYIAIAVLVIATALTGIAALKVNRYSSLLEGEKERLAKQAQEQLRNQIEAKDEQLQKTREELQQQIDRNIVRFYVNGKQVGGPPE